MLGEFEFVVVGLVAHAQLLGRGGVGAFEDAGRSQILLLLAHFVTQARQNQNHAIVALLQRLLHRHRIGDAAIEIRHTIHHIRLAGHRHGGRSLDDVEIIKTHARFVEVLGRAVLGIAGHHGEPGLIGLERREIQRILAIVIAQRAVDVVEVGKVVVLEEAFRTRVLLAEGVLGVEGVVAAVLACDE